MDGFERVWREWDESVKRGKEPAALVREMSDDQLTALTARRSLDIARQKVLEVMSAELVDRQQRAAKSMATAVDTTKALVKEATLLAQRAQDAAENSIERIDVHNARYHGGESTVGETAAVTSDRIAKVRTALAKGKKAVKATEAARDEILGRAPSQGDSRE